MRLNAHTRGSSTIIAFDGSLDSGTAPGVQEEIDRLMPQAGTVILDLSKMVYMSSAGLRVLLLIHRRARRDGAKIVLAGLVPDVREVMSATGFLDFFEVMDDFERDKGISA